MRRCPMCYSEDVYYIGSEGEFPNYWDEYRCLECRNIFETDHVNVLDHLTDGAGDDTKPSHDDTN